MPPIQVFQCPSCGANLSYDGGPEISFNCQFCGTSIIVPEELRPKAAEPSPAEPLPATPVVVIGQAGVEVPSDLQAELKDLLQLTTSPQAQAARMAEVAQMARAGQKLQAIKLFREAYPTLSLAEAEKAVNAMGGGPPSQPPATFSQPVTAARPRAGRSGCAGLGCGSGFLLVLMGAAAAFFLLPMRLSGSYQQALDAARTNPAVIAALGAPVEASGWPTNGTIACQANTCTAGYVIPIRGAKKSGRIDVMSNSQGASFLNEGTWTLNAVVVVDNGPHIQLTAGQLAASSAAALPTAASHATATLSALQVDATAGAESKATKQAEATQTVAAAATRAARQAATATQAAQATTEAVAAATASAEVKATAQAISTTQAAWPRVLSDSFADDHLGWPTGPANDSLINVNVSVKGQKYTWSVTPKGSAYASGFPAEALSLTDFSASVKVKFVQGGQDGNTVFGLMFRHSEPDYSFFGITPAGQYVVRLSYAAGPDHYALESSPAIHTQAGQVNQLAVQAVGSDLVFLINSQVVYQITEDLPAGDVGVGVDTTDKGKAAQAEFSNFEVRAPKP